MSLYIFNATLIYFSNFTLNKYSNFSLSLTIFNATLSLSLSNKGRVV